MAVSSHLTLNLRQEPSIFEIFAAELLDKICYPAFFRFFKFLGDEYSVNFDASSLLSSGLLGILQSFYLKKYGASFGESFYGLQRTDMQSESLSVKKKIISVILLVLPQYLEGKYKAKLYRDAFITKILSNILLLYNGVRTAQTLAYMMHLVETHSPILWFLRLKLNYPQAPTYNDKVIFILFKMFEVLAFFLQFVQWWHSNSHQQKLHSLSNPPEIKKNCDIRKNTCPICLQPLDTPTANSVTGFVYCWKCISTQIRLDKRCPVTNLSTDFKDLIRIFES